MTLRKREGTESERGGPRSHCMEKAIRKKLWTCRKTDCEVNDDSCNIPEDLGVSFCQSFMHVLWY